MKYINQHDLDVVIQPNMLTSSIQQDSNVIDTAEEQAIEEVKAYLCSSYKVDEIFAETPIRNPLIVRTIVQLVVYRCVRRNAARKVPDDYAGMEDSAYSLLDKIAAGKLKLQGVPEVTNPDGTPKLAWGNSRKSDNFI